MIRASHPPLRHCAAENFMRSSTLGRIQQTKSVTQLITFDKEF